MLLFSFSSAPNLQHRFITAKTRSGYFLLLFILLPVLLAAQFPEGSIFTKSLEEAKKAPEKVVELDLSGQNLTSFPPEILKMKNLAFLGLSQNNIQEIPDEIGELKKLYKLGLVDCQLKTLPASIGNLTELAYLHLEKNDLDSLPESLGQLRKLKRLTLSENKLKKIPDNIGELDQLEWLFLGNNELNTLPASIGHLNTLQVLLVSLNQLEELPESIGELDKLEQFGCTGNRLKTLPESFGNLQALRKLTLSDNLTLSDLPASMSKLTKLESIQMGNCAFAQLPISICQLPQLKVLFANKNQISILPNEIKNLQSLESLNLSGNPLEKDLNEGVYELKKLRTLMLAGNGFTNEEVASIREKTTQMLCLAIVINKTKTSMKKVWPLAFLFLLVGCATDKNKPRYLRWVGDIEADAEIDGDTFQLCYSEARVKQYFNFSKGMQYEGEKPAIVEVFRKDYEAVAVPQSGWIRIRFIVNCKGESGRFRLTSSNPQYQKQAFDPKITNQLLSITQSLKGWKPLPDREDPRDYYQYLTFKIENGTLKEILP